MGCCFRRTVPDYANSKRPRIDNPHRYEISSWYKVCREGNAQKLLEMLPLLTYEQLNRTEDLAKGSTPLHVACFRNHFEVARILICCGCDRHVRNKFQKTPWQETTSREILELFAQIATERDLCQKIEDLSIQLEADQWAPNNQFIIGHRGLKYVYDAKEMVRMYRAPALQRAAMANQIRDSYKRLHALVEKCIPAQHPKYQEAIECINRRDPLGLIKLYTLETDFYAKMQSHHTDFTVNIFLRLANFRNRAYKGRSYRGMRMAHFDLLGWRWASRKPGRLIETRTFMSTSELPSVAEEFASRPPMPRNKVQALFTFDFPRPCDTAIKLTRDESRGIKEDLTAIPEEKEVLVAPYTLFEVGSIDFDETLPGYRVHLIHVPID